MIPLCQSFLFKSISFVLPTRKKNDHDDQSTDHDEFAMPTAADKKDGAFLSFEEILPGEIAKSYRQRMFGSSTSRSNSAAAEETCTPANLPVDR